MMNKLLSAEFTRLFKSRLFKVCMFLSGALGALFIIVRWMDVRANVTAYANLPREYSKADDMIFFGPMFVVFVMAIFTGLFVGTEYSDGTIRNKLIVGHKRSSIYISKLVVCIVANIIIHAICIFVPWGLGSLLLGVDTGAGVLLAKVFMLFVIVITMTALLLLISMLIQSKSIGSVSCLSFMLIILLIAGYINSRLDAPEYYGGYSLVDENGDFIEMEQEKNPSYLSGKKRDIYEFVYDVLPSGQMFTVSYGKPKNIMMVYDIIILIGATTAGVIVFKKKNLK
ncbi:MAG: ABC transporter permease [Lachnospiraceae bacterium]|nr:ABC transporter permease [Lachnospiraceae bacterium]